MIKTRPVYVMVSQTDSGIARMIRTVTHYPYNHVSLTLDPQFTDWYSFARYVQDVPLYGGFIRETPARLMGEQGDAQVRIFRVEIPEKSAAELEAMLPLAGQRDSGLIYNHLDVLASAIGSRIQVPGCHTCLSFASQVLGSEFKSIEALCDSLSPWQVYEGSLADLIQPSVSREDDYYSRLGLLRGSSCTAAMLGLLLYRTVCYGFDSYKALLSRRTAL